MPQQKVLSVESIRGWACFMVLLSHLSLTFYPFLHAFARKADPEKNPIQYMIHESPFGFLFSGTSAVFIFFVLSGFILTRVALKGDNPSRRILLMGVKRYPRLMLPSLASCLIACIGFNYLKVNSPELSDWINQYGNQGNYSLYGAIYSGMFDVFFLSGRSAYNPVLWTMQIELLGSFVVYLLCLNRVTTRIPFLVEACIIAAFAGFFLKITGQNLSLGLVSFCGGHLFAIHGRKISTPFAVLLAGVGLYIAGAHNSSWSYAFISQFLDNKTYTTCNFVSGFIIVYAILFNDRLNSMFSGKLSVLMGKLSFSAYLLHFPIISTLGVITFNHLFKLTGAYDFSAISASICSIIATYAASTVFYRYIDAKGMLLSNYLAMRLIR